MHAKQTLYRLSHIPALIHGFRMFIIMFNYLYLCLCTCACMYMCVPMCVSRALVLQSDLLSWRSILSVLHVGPGDETQLIGLGSRHSYPLSQLVVHKL